MAIQKKQTEHARRGKEIAKAYVKALSKVKKDYEKSGRWVPFESIKDRADNQNKPKNLLIIMSLILVFFAILHLLMK
jgi:hypothetical protein